MPWYAQLQIFKNWRYVTLEISPSILVRLRAGLGMRCGVAKMSATTPNVS